MPKRSPSRTKRARPTSSGRSGGSSRAKAAGSKTAKKKAAKKASAKRASKKTDAKKNDSRKTAAKKAATKKSQAKPAKAASTRKTTKAAKAPARTDRPAEPPPQAIPAKSGRKGITIVSRGPRRPNKPKETASFPPLGDQLLKPGGPLPKPLIPSGPNNRVATSILANPAEADARRKPRFSKKQLAKFKAVLLAKRAELVGDVSTIESEALKSDGGSLSHLSQHIAEQGSDAYDQSLSLGIAAADRRLIKQIDEALKRLDDGTYGYCALTGKPIRLERLTELPWTQYSIEAARELERRNNP